MQKTHFCVSVLHRSPTPARREVTGRCSLPCLVDAVLLAPEHRSLDTVRTSNACGMNEPAKHKEFPSHYLKVFLRY